ncbi:MAG TPA: hypothetical protein VL863_13020 [bacterium]|nr:hypothetical protein [bacterium]
MNKHIKRNLGKTITTLSLIGFTAGLAWAADTINQSIPCTYQNSGSGSGCPGTWTGYAKMTNTVDGTFWIDPPTNVVSGTLTDASGFASPYSSVASVKSKNHLTEKWCDTNSVTFTATNTDKYSLTIYVKSPMPPPTNGQPMNIRVTWQTQ